MGNAIETRWRQHAVASGYDPTYWNEGAVKEYALAEVQDGGVVEYDPEMELWARVRDVVVRRAGDEYPTVAYFGDKDMRIEIDEADYRMSIKTWNSICKNGQVRMRDIINIGE